MTSKRATLGVRHRDADLESGDTSPQSKWRPYPKYKASGVEWLGEIPATWRCVRLRYVTRLNPTKNEIHALDSQLPVSFVPMEAVGEYGGLKLEDARPLGTLTEGYTYFKDGDVVIAKITPCFENGKGAIAQKLINGIAFGTTELHVLRPRQCIDAHFLFYLTLSDQFRSLGTAEMLGAAGQKRVPEDFILDFPVPFPNLQDQRFIAAFLNRETAKIDVLIENKERLIELLQEKRTALITQAVTKGLDPNVPMKDSGVEWIDNIPINWSVCPLFTVAREREEINFGNLVQNVLSLSYGKIIDRDVTDNFGLLPESFETYQIVHEGNIILRLTDLQNDKRSLRVGLVNHPGIITSAYICLELFRDIEPSYGHYLLHAYDITKVFYSFGGGVRQTMKFEDLKWLPILKPSRDEQRTIASFLDRETAKTDALVANIHVAINLLQEYRTALISAAVTGKIDVRGEVAQ